MLSAMISFTAEYRRAHIIVGHWILALGIGVIPPAILVAKVEDGGCGRHGVGGLIVTKGGIAKGRVAIIAFSALSRHLSVRPSREGQAEGRGTHVNFERGTGAASPFSRRVVMGIGVSVRQVV